MIDPMCLTACSRVSLRCSSYHGDPLNWDQPFTVSASCDECNAAPQHIHFSWILYVVDASSKPIADGKKGRFAFGWQPSLNRKYQTPFFSSSPVLLHGRSQPSGCRHGATLASDLSNSSFTRNLCPSGWGCVWKSREKAGRTRQEKWDGGGEEANSRCF